MEGTLTDAGRKQSCAVARSVFGRHSWDCANRLLRNKGVLKH